MTAAIISHHTLVLSLGNLSCAKAPSEGALFNARMTCAKRRLKGENAVTMRAFVNTRCQT